MRESRFWATLAAALAVALTASLAGPTDARADRCNPDEMIAPVYTLATGQPYEPVFGEDDGPFCYAMKTAVYPAIGCDPVYQSLMQCVQSQPARTLSILSGVCQETVEEVGETSVLGYQATLGTGVARLCYAMTTSECSAPLDSPAACVQALSDRVRALLYPCGGPTTSTACPCYSASCPDPARSEP
jgi:hypothetical protein